MYVRFYFIMTSGNKSRIIMPISHKIKMGYGYDDNNTNSKSID